MPAAGVRFPDLRLTDLNGRPVALPGGLPGNPTVVIISFQRAHARSSSSWVAGLGLSAPDAPAWIKLPVVGQGGQLGRADLDNAMRRAIPKPADRARVITAYVDPGSVLTALGLPNAEQTYTLVVSRSGTVHTIAAGAYCKAGGAQIRKALAR